MATSDQQPRWQRSARCTSGTCIEVAKVADRVLIQDSKSPDAGALSFTRQEWEAFIQAVKRDEFRLE